MMKSNPPIEKILKEYDYKLPENLIATEPARPRDSAKLLIYTRKNGQVQTDAFYNIDKYLPHNTTLVLNDTKVIPARFILHKESGGKIEAFYIRHDYDKIVVLLNKGVNKDATLHLNKDQSFSVVGSEGKYFFLKPNFVRDVFKTLEQFGHMPIPKYIKGDFVEKKLRHDYQSIFAKNNGSVAAPTASLHFTKRLLKKLEKRGISKEFITLHVNEGTFAPLKENNLTTKTLHEEYFEIEKNTASRLNAAKKRGDTIIGVGTTVIRTLESSQENCRLTKRSGTTRLFIQEHDSIHFADGIITNFHLPSSSLMMLVSAFIGKRKLLDLYALAREQNFRFYSFGDAMLIL